MKTRYVQQIPLAFCLCLFFRVDIALSQSKGQGEYPPVTIENTELRTLASKHVLNQTYQLKIDLPESYFKSDTTHYPVLYLTDADQVFGIASDVVDFLRWGKYWGNFMSEIIIVGIAYGSKYKEGGNMRARDFRPFPLEWDPEGVLGADLFLKFITDELFPFVEANYRVDKNDKTLFGSSAGGVFGIYVLFTNPDIFNRYIISSPALLGHGDAPFKLEESFFKERKDLPAKVYMSMGEFEQYYPPFPRFVKAMESRNYRGLEFKHELLNQGRHGSGVAEALTRGLKYVYGQESIYELMFGFIKQKNVQFAINQYHKLRQTAPGKYKFNVSQLGMLGWILLKMERTDDAIAISKLNIETYPDSASVYVDMAVTYMEIGNKESAIEYANRTLEILAKTPQADSESLRGWALEILNKLQVEVDKE